MNVMTTDLPGLLLIEPKVFPDARGYFLETYNAERYRAAGVAATFVQDNVSFSARNTLRGLHFQNPHPQGKLVFVHSGEVFDVAVDLREGSPTYGHWYGVTLSAENHRQVYVPPGFAHGYCVTSETALFAYKCTDFYHPESEICLLWNDPDICIAWPVAEPVLSSRDRSAPRLKNIPPERLHFSI